MSSMVLLNPYQAEIKPMIDFLKGALPYDEKWFRALPIHQLRAIYWKEIHKRNDNATQYRQTQQRTLLEEEYKSQHEQTKVENGISYIKTDGGFWEEEQV